MAVLVTGGAGYVGSVIVEDLRARAEEVVVLDNLSRGHRSAVDHSIPFYRGNVGDPVLAARIAGEHRIDACVHCAAFAYVGESMTRPAQYFENNVAQTLAGLEALVAAGMKQVVFSSSCAVYGEPACMPIGEDTPQRPTNPYGWSKYFIERVLECYDRAYGLRFVALRYFNAAGATERLGEHHLPETHLIPNVLAVAQGRLPYVPVYGSRSSRQRGSGSKTTRTATAEGPRRACPKMGSHASERISTTPLWRVGPVTRLLPDPANQGQSFLGINVDG